MSTLSEQEIGRLLEPYLPSPAALLLSQLSLYLDVLVKWNARTNLSAIRDPPEIVRRHFGESLFAARFLPTCRTLLDLGSGAGFPGLPIALLLPQVAVTLAESQNKKASFLREVVRSLGVTVEVFSGRVETMPAESVFDVVTMRAVDQPDLALRLAAKRLAVGGRIAHLTTRGVGHADDIAMPGSEDRVVRIG